MKLIGIRSIPLSKDTRHAWNSVGVRFVRRDKGSDQIFRITERFNYDGVLNLGNLQIDLDDIKVPVWNWPDTIRSISSATALRRTLNDYIPPRTVRGPHWHKQGGFGGDGKLFHEKELPVCSRIPGDVQAHVEGTEFRVITVGNAIVQASSKELLDGVGNFNWHWVGVDGIRTNGIIPHVKSATELISSWETAVLGWDIISNGKIATTIEINTSPGVNEATAERIVNQMGKVM